MMIFRMWNGLQPIYQEEKFMKFYAKKIRKRKYRGILDRSCYILANSLSLTWADEDLGIGFIYGGSENGKVDKNAY